MNIKVKLDDITNALEFQSEEGGVYLDKSTGQVVILSEEDFYAAREGNPIEDYPDWQHNHILFARRVENEDVNLIALPSKFDIHEYHIMEEYCYSIEDEDVSSELSHSLKGSGAFRRFKDTIHRLNVENDWYAYRENALKNIAIEWCKENKVEYKE